jgi:hypothetical protein
MIDMVNDGRMVHEDEESAFNEVIRGSEGPVCESSWSIKPRTDLLPPGNRNSTGNRNNFSIS